MTDDLARAKRIIGRLWPLRAELRGLWQSYAELSEAYTDVYADRDRAIRERADANRRAGQRLTEIKQLKAAPHGYVTQEVAQGLRTDLAETRAEVERLRDVLESIAGMEPYQHSTTCMEMHRRANDALAALEVSDGD